MNWDIQNECKLMIMRAGISSRKQIYRMVTILQKMGNEYMQPAHILLQWLVRKIDPKNAQKFLSEIENTQKIIPYILILGINSMNSL